MRTKPQTYVASSSPIQENKQSGAAKMGGPLTFVRSLCYTPKRQVPSPCPSAACGVRSATGHCRSLNKKMEVARAFLCALRDS